jgi:hypothetical protein
MLTKPWNLYVFRHSALTEKSQFLTEAVLRSHAGWTMNSSMPRVYIHLSDESSKILLQKKGLIRKGDTRTTEGLKSRQCPNCSEPNRQDVKFCFHCRMVLSYDSYRETLDTQKEKEDKLTRIEQRFELMQSEFENLISAISSVGEPSKTSAVC